MRRETRTAGQFGLANRCYLLSGTTSSKRSSDFKADSSESKTNDCNCSIRQDFRSYHMQLLVNTVHVCKT